MNPVSETCVVINAPTKNIEKINCPKCNKPNMSKKNISTHYKKGCSGVKDLYRAEKVKKTKEQREQEKIILMEQKEKEKHIKKQLKEQREQEKIILMEQKEKEKHIKKQLKEQKEKERHIKKEQKEKEKEEKMKLKKVKNPKPTKKQDKEVRDEENKLSFQECYGYMCWLHEKKLFNINAESFKEYYNDYIMDMKEPIKLVINKIVKKKETQDKNEKIDDMINSVQNINDKEIQQIQEIQEIIKEEEPTINYCISCEVNNGEEQYNNYCEECYGKILQIEQMIKDDDVVDDEELSDEEEEKEEQQQKEKEEQQEEEEEEEEEEQKQEELKVEPTNEIIQKQEDSDSEYEYETDNDDNYKPPPINEHDIFFERYENEIETDDEKLIVDQLNKFMQRFNYDEVKKYSSDERQGKSIVGLRNKRQIIIHWLKYHDQQLYYLKYNGDDFFIKYLLKLIVIKIDKIYDEDEDDGEYEPKLSPQIETLISYYVLEMRKLMDKIFPILVEK